MKRMKNQIKQQKSAVTLGSCFLIALKIWGSAWLGCLVAMIPVYIYKGVNKNNDEIEAFIETILIWGVGLLAASIILMFLVARSDESERWTPLEMRKVVAVSVGFYLLAWIIYGIFSANNVTVSATGAYLSKMIDQGTNGFPTFWGNLSGAIVYGAFYAGAIVLGWRIAFRRAQKRRTELLTFTKQD